MSSKVWQTKKGPYGNALRSGRTGKPIRYQIQPDKSVLPRGPMQVAITPQGNRMERVQTQRLSERSGVDIVEEIKKVRDGWKLDFALREVESCLIAIEHGSIYQAMAARMKLRDKYAGVYQVVEAIEGEEGWESPSTP